MARRLSLEVLPQLLSICRFPPDSAIPDGVCDSDFFSVTRTSNELSVITATDFAPPNCEKEDGWRAIRVGVVLDFSLTGVITAIASPLAEASISILPISTYETDYFILRETDLQRAIEILRKSGHYFDSEPSGAEAKHAPDGPE